MAAIEAAFKTTLKNVKNALKGNGSTLNIYSTYLYERSSHIVLLYAGTERPFKTEAIWGLFPDKGPRKKLGQGYALYHRDTFLHEFQNKTEQGIVGHAHRLLSISPSNEQCANTTMHRPSKKSCLRRNTNPKNINTAEKAHEEIFEMTVQEAILQIALDVCSETVRTIQDSEPLDIANAIISEVVNVTLPEIASDCIQAVTNTENLKEVDPIPPQEEEAAEALDRETMEETSPTCTFQQQLSFCSPFSPTFNSLPDFSESPLCPRNLFGEQQSAYVASFHDPNQNTISLSVYGTAPTTFPPTLPQPIQVCSIQPPSIQCHTQAKQITDQIATYMQRHRWVKCWGERKQPTLPAGSKGKAARHKTVEKIQVPAPNSTAFKNTKPCKLFQIYGRPCMAMEQQQVSKHTPYICFECAVYLHKECSSVYHAFHARERVDLELLNAWFARPSL